MRVLLGARVRGADRPRRGATMTNEARWVLLAVLGAVGCGEAAPETSVGGDDEVVAADEQGVEGSATALRAGPMVGAVTPASARIWGYAGGPASLQVRYRKAGATTWTYAPMPAPATDRYA